MADNQPDASNFSENQHDPAPAIPAAENNIIEQNLVIRENVEDRVSLFVSKFIYWFRIAMFSALAIEVVIVLSLKWDEPACSLPLRGFLVAYGINSSLVLLTNIIFYKSLVRSDPLPEEPTFLSRFLRALHQISEVMDQLLLLFGFFMITQSGTGCPKTSPVLWIVSLQIVIVRFAVWLVPLLLLTCMFFSITSLIIIVSKFKKWQSRRKVEEMLGSIPLFSYKDSQNTYGSANISRENADCAICISSYENESPIRILPCQHHFHQECIDHWLCISPECPLCKRSIFTAGDSANV